MPKRHFRVNRRHLRSGERVAASDIIFSWLHPPLVLCKSVTGLAPQSIAIGKYGCKVNGDCASSGRCQKDSPSDTYGTCVAVSADHRLAAKDAKQAMAVLAFALHLKEPCGRPRPVLALAVGRFHNPIFQQHVYLLLSCSSQCVADGKYGCADTPPAGTCPNGGSCSNANFICQTQGAGMACM